MKNISIWKRSILIISLFAVSVVAVFAWLITSDRASAENLDSDVTDASYIKVSQDGGETWENGIDGVELENMRVISEISGNGEEFYEPIYGERGIEGFAAIELDDRKYIEKEFIFEADRTQEVYLKSESLVSPADPEGNKNENGVSRDYIAGAVRIAFFEVTESGEELKYIWAPNPRIEYRDGYVDPSGTVEESYSYQVGTALDDALTVETGGASSGKSGVLLWGDPETDGAVPLISLETENKVAVRGKILVRIWIEGTDRECEKGLHNGNFKINLKFDEKA